MLLFEIRSDKFHVSCSFLQGVKICNNDSDMSFATLAPPHPDSQYHAKYYAPSSSNSEKKRTQNEENSGAVQASFPKGRYVSPPPLQLFLPLAMQPTQLIFPEY